MENFPTEIIENILFRLPIEEALQAKRVCTTWKALLRDYISHKVGFLFAFSHRDKIGGRNMVREELFYEDEYDHYDSANINYYHLEKTLSKIQHSRYIATSYRGRDIMVGSCNGLACFRAAGIDRFLVCNPLTGESIFLPEFREGLYYSVGSGFGYCPSTNSYKVVTICYHHLGKQKGYIHVYTVGGKWRSIEYIGRHIIDYSTGVYAYGAIYWWHQYQYDYGLKESAIVAFDLEDEKFHSIPMPHFKYEYSSQLKLLGGNNNLYLAHLIYKDCCIARIDIWVYKRNGITDGGTSYATQDYNIKQSDHNWIKEFSIQSKEEFWFIKPFAITRNKEVLLFKDYLLSRYDPKSSTLYKLWDNNVKNANYIESTTHTQSLVSLKDLGETDVTYLKDLERPMLQEGFSKDDAMGYGDTPVPRAEVEEDCGKPAKTREAKKSRNC